MTPDTAVLFARYNKLANSEMNKILSLLSEEEWKRDFGGYYKSIRSLCAHIYAGDSNWLYRFKMLRNFTSLAPVPDRIYGWDAEPFDAYGEYEKKRNELDSIIISFSKEVSQEDFAEQLKYVNLKGIPQDRNFGGLVIHMFNHQTHHRGMISLYLDMLGRENDFSNLLSLI